MEFIMIQKENNLVKMSLLLLVLLFLVSSCSSTPKKAEPPQGKTITVEGMETVKGVNPPKAEETAPAKKTPPPPPSMASQKPEQESRTASLPPISYAPPSLPFFTSGYKKKVVILPFENKTTYQEEKIGEVASKRFSDKLEVTQRAIIVNPTVVSETLKKQGGAFESLMDSSIMKLAHHAMGIQAFVTGTVSDVSILSSKTSETTGEEVSFATAKVEVQLTDASTGNLLRASIGRSPIFGTKEAGEYSRSKAVLKAIEFSLDDVLDGFLRTLDVLDWSTTIARIEGQRVYLNAGKLSGLRIGDVLEVYEPGKEIIHSKTKLSLGWTTGELKGAVKVMDLFGVDAAVGQVVEGKSVNINDVVKSAMR
jgi:hypothetical protein